MTIEEKAKAYDKIIARANKMYNENIDICKACIEELIPEIAESEDEKIRKELIKMFKETSWNDSSFHFYNLTKEQILAWLEKQGERKFVIVPKFRVGDTIIPKPNLGLENTPFTITKIEDDTYFDGDNSILVCNQDDFELVEHKPVEKSRWCDSMDELIADALIEEIGKSKRRQEEKDNRIYWINKHRQKPVEWSEEDERMFNSALWHIKNSCGNQGKNSGEFEVYNWLKTIKDRYLPQTKYEWSKEDEKYFNILISLVNNPSAEGIFDYHKINKTVFNNWTRELKNKCVPQQKQEWSEEELAVAKKDAFNEALDKIEYSSGEPTFDDGWSAAVSFFRKKNIVPQKQWKPSKEQIVDLLQACNFFNANLYPLGRRLNTLLDQLKAL